MIWVSLLYHKPNLFFVKRDSVLGYIYIHICVCVSHAVCARSLSFRQPAVSGKEGKLQGSKCICIYIYTCMHACMHTYIHFFSALHPFSWNQPVTSVACTNLFWVPWGPTKNWSPVFPHHHRLSPPPFRGPAQEGPDARFAARSARKLGDLFKGAPPDMESAPLVVI